MRRYAATPGHSLALPASATAAVLVLALAAGFAPGVVPYTWVASTEADFSAGKLESAVITSRGEAILAREVQVLIPSTSAPPVISAVLGLGKVVYASAGNTNVIYRIEAGHAKEFAKPAGTMVNCLLWTGREILAGTGGDGAGIYRVAPNGKTAKVWADAKVKYVWALLLGKDRQLYAATGPEGKVYRVDARGHGAVVFDAGDLAKNVLCLARGKDGLLYAGTDTTGLVVEIDTRRHATRVLFDAPEKEISALVATDEGALYAATADAARASADGKDKPSGEKNGKTTPATKPAAKPKASEAKPPSAPAGKAAPAPSPAKSGSPTISPPKPAKADVGKSGTPSTALKPNASPSGAGPDKKPEPKAVLRIVRPSPPSGPPSSGKPAATPSPRGNAVYQIAPDGLVTTLFRRPVTILAMLLHKDQLLLGTGNGGRIYAVDLDGDKVTPLIDTDAKQITCLAPRADGTIAFGSANKGSVGTVSPAYAKKGTVTSNVLDAKQITRWGTIRGRAQIPAGCSLTVATRSGNVAKADERTWSSWSREQLVDGEYRPIMSPTARFLQFRLTLTGNGKATPLADELRMIHQVGNLAPELTQMKVLISNMNPDNKPQPTRLYRHILLQATDPNKDRIAFEIDFRKLGDKNWINITKKLTSPKYIWDTRTVGDGLYELRVTATDARSNPASSAKTHARVSDPLVIDNTAPLVQGLVSRLEGDTVVLTGTAVDQTSRIAVIYYAVDSQSEWHAVLATDGICDSPREKFQFTVTDLKPGPHRIAVKAYDYYGNTGYAAVTVEVPK